MKHITSSLSIATLLLLSTGAATAAPQETPGRDRETRIVLRDATLAEGARWLTNMRRGFLGVQLMPLTPELRQHYGAPREFGLLVASVSDDSPASRAGIRVGDVLVEVAGKKLERHLDVSGAIADKKSGDRVTISAIRNGAPLQLSAAIEERDRQVVALNRMPGDLRILQGSGPEELREFFAGEEWKDRIFRIQDCADSQQRLRELESRLQELEKRIR